MGENGCGQLFAAREKQRMSQYFKTRQEAVERVQTKGKEERSHVPKEFDGDLQKLMDDVQYWPNQPLNWSAKAREYKIKKKRGPESPPNAGQLLKEYLSSKGVDVNRFNRRQNGGKRVRRVIQKQRGGEISLPVPWSNTEVRNTVKDLIQNGTCNIGIPIAETEHVKLVIDADGNVAKAVTKVHGRKIPLQEIQKESLKKNREFLKIHNGEFFEKMTIEEIIHKS